MKMTWKKKSSNKRLAVPNLPFDFDNQNEDNPQFILQSNSSSSSNNNNNNNNNNDNNKEGQLSNEQLADVFLQQGNQLAQDSKYREALGKWETAITLMPKKAVLHEQKAQVLLEIGDSWGALKAATRATELDPSWAEAWTTLGRAQLNFGEPDSAVATFDKALSIKADLAEAKEDRQTALQLVKKRKQLHSSGLSTNSSRFTVMEAKPA